MNLYGETFARFYDRHFGAYAENLSPVLLAYFSSLAASSTQLRILDLGCGTGNLALHFLEAGYSVVGIDLSPHMLRMAEARCWGYVAAHRARFLEKDISHFRIGTSFGLALSTYNVMNHMESEKRIRECLKSVRACLTAGTEFLFDFHTLKGLEDWAGQESAYWQNEACEMSGEFDRLKGMARMRLKGRVDGSEFEQMIVNYSFPLEKVAGWVNQEGFQNVHFSRIDDPRLSLKDPEMENRVMVIAS